MGAEKLPPTQHSMSKSLTVLWNVHGWCLTHLLPSAALGVCARRQSARSFGGDAAAFWSAPRKSGCALKINFIYFIMASHVCVTPTHARTHTHPPTHTHTHSPTHTHTHTRTRFDPYLSYGLLVTLGYPTMG